MSGQESRARLTAGRVAAWTCPPGKAQAFLWDTEAPSLALRVTPTGRKTYVFESRLKGATVRIAIGTAADWPIEKARTKAQEYKRLTDAGKDPRELERQQAAQEAAEAAQQAAQGMTTGEAWSAYLADRRPHWGERHYADHEALARAGGEKAKRGTRGRGVTIAGPIFPLLARPLRELDSAAVEAWAAQEAKSRPTQARLALRVLKAFLNWCAVHPDYRQALAGDNPAKSKRAREVLGRAGVKQDALLREQLPAWFAAVCAIGNPAASAYLQILLMTGARPGEVLAMRWEDVNLKWKGLTIRDKVEGERVIPLTPYVSQLLAGLPRRNEWVFASTRTLRMDAKNVRRRAQRTGDQAPAGGVVQASETGHITEPRNFHTEACAVAGIEGLTLHGLRRSFKSLTEWLETPAGVVAQIMGHKPSATAEKHYTVRPLDLLRLHHERIEAWILEQAGLPPVKAAEPQGPRLVAAAPASR